MCKGWTMRVTLCKPDPSTPMTKGAILSGCNSYRYLLWRIWDHALPLCGFCMLNPSVADAEVDDPTMIRCMGFAQLWGFGGIVLCNLFAWRSTDPKKLDGAHAQAVGPHNDDAIRAACWATGRMVMAWGAYPASERVFVVRRILRASNELGHLGRTVGGAPKHPVRLASLTEFQKETLHG